MAGQAPRSRLTGMSTFNVTDRTEAIRELEQVLGEAFS
jgi:hypothetical protein